MGQRRAPTVVLLVWIRAALGYAVLFLLFVLVGLVVKWTT